MVFYCLSFFLLSVVPLFFHEGPNTKLVVAVFSYDSWKTLDEVKWGYLHFPSSPPPEKCEDCAGIFLSFLRIHYSWYCLLWPNSPHVGEVLINGPHGFCPPPEKGVFPFFPSPFSLVCSSNPRRTAPLLNKFREIVPLSLSSFFFSPPPIQTSSTWTKPLFFPLRGRPDLAEELPPTSEESSTECPPLFLPSFFPYFAGIGLFRYCLFGLSLRVGGPDPSSFPPSQPFERLFGVAPVFLLFFSIASLKEIMIHTSSRSDQ